MIEDVNDYQIVMVHVPGDTFGIAMAPKSFRIYSRDDGARQRGGKIVARIWGGNPVPPTAYTTNWLDQGCS